MISTKMNTAICQQINHEMYSAYLYLSMSNYANLIGLKGFARWFMVQYHEEMFHSMKLLEYVQKQGGQPALMAIDKPEQAFASVIELFEKTLEHEQFITRCVNDLMELAKEERDNATQIFLQWYVTEQIEEENNDTDILNQLRFVANDPRAILMLDRELATRTVAVPTDYSNGMESALGLVP